MMPIQAKRTRVLPRPFFDRDSVTVAWELLGTLLCHDDRGPTLRNAAMFGLPGHAYVYAMHRYYCLNVVTQGEGIPRAILLRAVEPLQGVEVMLLRRRTERYTNLASATGKRCQAFGIDRSLDQWDLTQRRRLWLTEPGSETEIDFVTTPRIGVTSAQDLLLRFCDAASACLSPGIAVGIKAEGCQTWPTYVLLMIVQNFRLLPTRD